MDDIRKYMEIVDRNSVDHRTEALTVCKTATLIGRLINTLDIPNRI